MSLGDGVVLPQTYTLYLHNDCVGFGDGVGLIQAYTLYLHINCVGLGHGLPCWPCGKATAWRAEDLGLIPGFAKDLFSRSSHTSNFKIGTPVAPLSGTWHYRTCAGTGWPGVSIL